MHIFRLPAHLNAKRFPWQCFRYQLAISNPSVFYSRLPSSCRPVLLAVSRLVSFRSRPALLNAFLPVPPLPVFLAVRSPRSRYHRPVCRVVGRGVVRKLVVAICCGSRPLIGICSVSLACQARPANRVGRRGGRRGGRALSMPSARLCGFRVVKVICIYSFGK